MKILKSILFATDLSKTSEYVLDYAIKMAKVFQSEITAIYVMPDDITNKKAKDLLNDYATKQLYATNVKINRAGVTSSEPILECGSFSDKIVEAADRINANMIIIGAGEELEEEVFILGSNAKKIIKKSIKPVFVVKNRKYLGIKRILCPIDFSEDSIRALQNAITMARRFEAELVVFTAYQVAHLYSIRHKINVEEEIEYIRNSSEKAMAEFLAHFELAGLYVKSELEQGPADDAILKAIQKHNPDLLIMGTTGRSGLKRILMGSVTEKVIEKTSTSFITIKKENLIELELQSKIRTIDEHYKVGVQLIKDGFFEDAINEFKACLDINFMHLPSLKALANVYESNGDAENQKKYTDMTKQVLEAMTNEKIESEIRNYRND